MSEHHPDAANAQPPEEPQGPSLGATILHHLITTALIVGTISFALWTYFNFRSGDFFYEPPSQEDAVDTSMQRYLVASQIQRFEFAAQAYLAIHNAPPQSMDDLITEGLILDSDLTYPSPSIEYALELEAGKVSFLATDARASGAPAPPKTEGDAEAASE